MNRRSFMKKLPCIILLAGPLAAADWKPLFNGKNLDGWEAIGDGQWTVMADGTLLGQRIGDLRKMLTPGGPLPAPQQFKGWVDTQSWLYTRRSDFGEFDLHLEYWTKTTGNSCVSIRDSSRAKWGIVTPPDYKRTPSKIGYEIQIKVLLYRTIAGGISCPQRSEYVSKKCITNRVVAFGYECVCLPCPSGARRHHRSGSGSNGSFDAKGEGNRHQPSY